MIAEEPQVAPLPGGALNQLIWSFTANQALYAAAKLGVPDALRDGPKTSREIAAAVGAAVFNAAMTAGSSASLPAILQSYDFSGFTRIVDVGGGQERSFRVFSNA